ncbi:MAG: aminodeoxychorismate/anthranilate synthase component II [Burkholderiales bacterium]|jgi:anthranilate synthase component 2|nr:aminodeoxychorismate/anthranilate synthase component II [Burkholderiales bacterium]
MTKRHILFIDNFDSFTFNLVDALLAFDVIVDVYRNDISAEEAMKIAQEKQSMMIVLSPGPGTPKDAGCLIPLIHQAAGHIPLLGICLGHQAIGEAFGGVVSGANEIVHGKKSKVTHQRHPIFAGIPDVFEAGRYHSLTLIQVPDELEVIATCGHLVMAVAHRVHPIVGVQFHPESILTTQGQTMIGNALSWAKEYR